MKAGSQEFSESGSIRYCWRLASYFERMDDTQLVQRMRSGDERAFDVFFDATPTFAPVSRNTKRTRAGRIWST